MNQRSLALILAIPLIAATPAKKPAGFVDLAQLVASHPLHSVLLAYDREIAALRSTQHLGVLSAATTAERAAAAVRRDASAAQVRAKKRSLRATRGPIVRASEPRSRRSLTSQRTGDREMDRYAAGLTRETNANVTNYGTSIAQRTDRAYAAREQQLSEKENTLAFALARRDAAKRLSSALEAGGSASHAFGTRALHSRAEGTRRLRSFVPSRHCVRSDAAVLTAYRRGLESSGNADQRGRWRCRLARSGGRQLGDPPARRASGGADDGDLAEPAAAAASFAPSYRLGDEARHVTGGFHAAGDELSSRFAQLADSANQSQRETSAAIGRLEATRAQLYRSIVAQIVNEARIVARRQGLGNVEVGNSRSAGSVDLTRAVRAGLATR